jgi:hypothetical protein
MITLSFFLLSKFWVIVGFAIVIFILSLLIVGYPLIYTGDDSVGWKTVQYVGLTLCFGFYIALVTMLFDMGAMSSGWSTLTKTYTEYKAGEHDEKVKNGTVEKIYLPMKVEQFRVVSFDPPKHVYVGLKHIRTGQLYENQYVSKHCSNKPTLHEMINIQVTPFYYIGQPDSIKWESNNLSKEVCS